MMKLTYRKALNKGWEPVWYRTDAGCYVALIVKRGPKWLHLKLTDGSNKRVRVSEERYMTPFKSKRG